SKKEAVNFLQIWVFPKERDIEPRYDQRSYDPDDRKNKFQLVVSPEKESSSLWINQDSYFSLTDLEKGSSIEYKLHNPANGIYLFLIEGSIRAGDIQLNKRDGLGIEDTNSINLTAAENSQLLLIEVPMK
ncbi:MAG TPA: hypothetical protein DCX92_07805, partial [Bacteroidetes bacterium]|nr:hypothetical protein [Bacteroidota bacterium]